jgi:phage terminase small subunit
VALKPRHAKFVAEYLKTSNATQAYLAAGYEATPETARRGASVLLTKRDIRQAIRQAKEDAAIAAQINQEWVLRNIRDVALRCMQAEPVLDREGEPTGEYTFNATGALRGLELLGKELDMFADRKVHDVGNNLLDALREAAQRRRIIDVTPTPIIEHDRPAP